ncbi:MAG: hypothetical protein JXB07_16425, partial [Anaerolineae bacterium]|nr:hypothetical protein [Anaerolineae bacterium]
MINLLTACEHRANVWQIFCALGGGLWGEIQKQGMVHESVIWNEIVWELFEERNVIPRPVCHSRAGGNPLVHRALP